MNPDPQAQAQPQNSAQNDYRKLGPKALHFFILERSAPTLLLIIFECILLGVKIASATSPSIEKLTLTYPMTNTALTYALLLVPILTLIVVILTSISAFVQYASFRYRIDENGFSFERGIIGKDEISLPFRQIQNVDIDQPLSYRLFGMCKMTILTAGHEDKDAPSQDGSEVELPALSLIEAQELQRRMLERSNIQRVVSVTPDQNS